MLFEKIGHTFGLTENEVVNVKYKGMDRYVRCKVGVFPGWYCVIMRREYFTQFANQNPFKVYH